ncbi:MAG TPA: MCE family protein [Nocardioidaceae bacterium]|nr:MCE family protein [Nocardioidaceae bacterium]
MSIPFRERNPVVVGAVSLAVIAALMLGAFRADSLPIIGGGDTYYAAFSEAGGLAPNNEVRIAGVRVGKVKSVELDGDQVLVKFQLDQDAEFGTETGAAIKIKTLLGAVYLALEPKGEGQLEEGTTIPIERTAAPYDVVKAFEGLAETTDRIDTDQLAQALDVLAIETKFAPEDFRSALQGVSRLSENIAARDAELGSLLGNLRKVSGVLGDRNEDIIGLMRDGDRLFSALVERRQAIHDLLVSTSKLSAELTGLVRQSRADLKPALDNLYGVVQLLEANQANLDNSLRLMAPFYRVFANTLGSGPWFDTIIQNMPPVPAVGG